MTEAPRSAFATSRRPEPAPERDAEPPLTKGKFWVGERDFQITIKMWDAITTLPDQFEIPVTDLFEGDNIDKLLSSMFMNDTLPLKLMHHYCKEELTYEQMARELQPGQLQQFKDVWWNVLMGFFNQNPGDIRGEILRQILRKAPILMKTQIEKSLAATLDDGVLSSQEKSD